MNETRFLDTPLGKMIIIGQRGVVTGLYFVDQKAAPLLVHVQDQGAYQSAKDQLQEWFRGTRRSFDFALELTGSPFQRQVWEALKTVPYGKTVTYGAIARAIGRPTAARACGAAIGRNPLAIVIPCHRVIGSSGALTGYAGGMDRKHWMLQHESASVGAPG
ncbi:MAG: methylated-DNA--[protein]-cysteine S-methyltransferase [Actinomycetota bacterium]